MTKILLIDDHPIVLQGCGRMLEDAGVTDVIEAADAAFGYRLFSGKRPEIVQLLSAARHCLQRISLYKPARRVYLHAIPRE